jgi:hypothetical protein
VVGAAQQPSNHRHIPVLLDRITGISADTGRFCATGPRPRGGRSNRAEDIAVRVGILLTRVLLSLAAGCVALVGVNAAARPEPSPCRDTVTIPAASICLAPQADGRVVFGSAGAVIAVIWLGSGQVQKRLTRA